VGAVGWGGWGGGVIFLFKFTNISSWALNFNNVCYICMMTYNIRQHTETKMGQN